jgi:serine/alanine adding enzyme
MTTTISTVTPDNMSEYNQFISSQDNATFVDFFAWREVVEQIYGLRHYWYLAYENGKVSGSLALTLAKHPVFGTYLSTAPFGSYGGFHAISTSAASCLLTKAEELCHKMKARYVVLRHLNEFDSFSLTRGWHNDNSYAIYHIPLESDPDHFFKNHLRTRVRQKIINAEKHRFYIKFGKHDLLPDFWYVISRAMRELGSPYHSFAYLDTVLKRFQESVHIAVVYDENNNPAYCKLGIQNKKKVYSIHANSLLKYRHLNVGDYSQWLYIQECYNRGLSVIDMGRSLIESGNDMWKMKWRPERRPLSYWYYLPKGQQLPQLNQNNPKYRILIKTWQNLPLFLLQIIGPHLISGIL